MLFLLLHGTSTVYKTEFSVSAIAEAERSAATTAREMVDVARLEQQLEAARNDAAAWKQLAEVHI